MKTSWNKGIPRTEKEKEKIRKSFSEEERKKRSERMKKRWADGKCDAFKGALNPSKRPEVAAKIGAANRKRIVKESTKEKIRKARTGKAGIIVSEKTKKLHSERMKKNNPMRKKGVVKNHPLFKSGIYFVSKGEKELISIFNKEGYLFEHQRKISTYTADFFFPERNKIIEYDGFYTHREFPEKDQKRDAYLWKHHGYRTLRILPKDLILRKRKTLLLNIEEFLDAD